jgi:thiol-disulfide isomerase/thioredoxin
MRRVPRIIAVALVMGSIGQAVQADLPPRLRVHDAPLAVPNLAFQDRDGLPLTLADFRGRTVLLNIWATWCIPCREEMPALDRLQARLGGDAFQVVALSIDRGGTEAVQRFYAETGVTHLEIFTGSTGRILHDLAVEGPPLTLLVDGEGREIARVIGPIVWDAPEIIEFIETRLKETVGSRPREPRPADVHSGAQLAQASPN